MIENQRADATMDRRQALYVLGMAVVAAACGGAELATTTSSRAASSAPPSSVPPNSTPAPQPPTTILAPETTTTVAPAPEFPAPLPPTSGGGEPLMPPEMVEELERLYAGTWAGTWTNADGSSGEVDGAVGLDPQTATLVVSLDVTGQIFGESADSAGGLSPASFSLPLGTNFWEWDPSPLGYFYISNTGSETAMLAVSDPPNAPDIMNIFMRLSYRPDGTAALDYDIDRRDGTTASGTLQVARI